MADWLTVKSLSGDGCQAWRVWGCGGHWTLADVAKPLQAASHRIFILLLWLWTLDPGTYLSGRWVLSSVCPCVHFTRTFRDWYMSSCPQRSAVP